MMATIANAATAIKIFSTIPSDVLMYAGKLTFGSGVCGVFPRYGLVF